MDYASEDIPTQFVGAKNMDVRIFFSLYQVGRQQLRVVVQVHFGLVLPKEMGTNC